MLSRVVIIIVVSVSIGSAAFAADMTGKFAAQTPDGPLLLTLHQESGKLAGTVQYQGREFSIAGNQTGDQLTGFWASAGGPAPFAASMDGNHLVLSTNGMTYQLQKGDQPDAIRPGNEIPSPAAAVDLSRWNDVVFPDNSGAVSVPDGWRIVAVRDGWPAVFGPDNEIVALGQRLAYSNRAFAYPGAIEAAKVIWTRYADTFNPPVKFVQIVNARDTGKTADGADSAEITFLADVGRPGASQRMLGHIMLLCAPPDARGVWKVNYSAMLAPEGVYAGVEPIMTRIWNSWQLNTQQLAANAQQQAAAELAHFRGQLNANAEQFAATRHTYDFTGGAVAQAQRVMNGSGRNAEIIGDILGGTGMAKDNETGRLVPLGNNTVGDLNGATHSSRYSPFYVTPDP